MVLKLTNSNTDKEQPSGVVTIPVDKLHSGKYQARISYPEEKLKQLASSIEKDGVIQPIVVCPSGEGYEVCAGWGRVLACRSVGKKEIPGIVRNLSEPEKAKLGVMENIQRQDLNIVERARAYKILQDTCSMTQEEIGRAVGVTRDVVAQTLRILAFPQEVQTLMTQGVITPSHAEALARLTSPQLLKEAIGEAIINKLTSSKTEELVDWILRRAKLRRDIGEFVNSEEFMLTLDYLLPPPPSPDEKPVHCPSCFDSGAMEYDEEAVIWRCSGCGWNNESAASKLYDLIYRSRYVLLKKRGVNNTFTKNAERSKLCGEAVG